MSGSIKNMIYLTDNGNSYAVRIDESNGEACGFTDVTTAMNTGLPKNIRPRYVNCVHPTDARMRRTFKIGTPSFYSSLLAGTESITTDDPLNSGTNVTWVITSFRAEQRAFYSGTDTGLNEGDDS